MGILLLRGAFAGFLATLPMSLVMRWLHGRLPPRDRYDLPPDLIAERFQEETGLASGSEEAKTVFTVAGHFGYGALLGAVYALLLARRGVRLRGPLFGTAVWCVSYLGWLPAARILPPATQDSPNRNLLMIFAHLVWGTCLQACEHLASLERRRPA